MKGLPRLPRFVAGAFEIREAFENIPKRDFRLHARECRAEAGVNSVAERNVRIGIARDVEAVPVRKLLWIAVGRSHHGEDQLAWFHRLATEVDRFLRRAHEPL